MSERAGIVVKVYGLYCGVFSGHETVNCFLRGRLRVQRDLERFSDPVAVGDRVIFDIEGDGSGVIREILPRKNCFSRREKGRHGREDVIAANLDQIVMIQSFDKPRLNLRLADRITMRGESALIPVVLCVNKRDLAGRDIVRYVKDYYKAAPITITMVSALTGAGMKSFFNVIKKKTSLFIGYSGVGKTSILKYIYPELELRVADVSESTGKGKHTTTNVEMIFPGEETRVIDTPGVREFGLMDIEPHMAGSYFHEFARYGENCLYRPCTHDHEPGCEVKRLVEEGAIHEDRYISYLNILNSLREDHGNRYG